MKSAREEATKKKKRMVKPKAHKRGGGNTGGQSKASYRDYRRRQKNMNTLSDQPEQQVAAAHPNRGRQNNRLKPKEAGSDNKQPQSKRKGKGKGRGTNDKSTKAKTLQPISCPSSSIMRGWKQALGPLIRYYVGLRCKEGIPQKEAEDEVDRMYFNAGCDKEETKLGILRKLGMKKTDKDLVELTMIIEKDEQLVDVPTSKENNVDDSMLDVGENDIYTETRDGRGLKLKQTIQRGEGPAHSHELWTNVIIPNWAVGKSFFFECKNNAPIPLSCELFLDGTKVAFNAPLPSNSDRSIKPDNPRYSHRHQWILAPAKRVKLQSGNSTVASSTAAQPVSTPRYNHIRPDYEGQRVNEHLYPDATAYGWRFTGSQQASRVEFFEKTMNIGLVKLDFYYTTATVKTTLYHPSTGANQLFRGGLKPEQYIEVLNNPRAHTNQGYRRRLDRPDDQNVKIHEDMSEDEDEFDQQPNQEKAAGDGAEEDGNADADGNAHAEGNTIYFARNDGYNFNRQGHQNRRTEMNKLQNSHQYSEWREANMAEYSVITAKFYVSIPKRQQGGQVNMQQRRRKDKELLQIPNQSSVADIKAAERATIGTKFEATGPANRISRSYVRMERIKGLSDEKDWKGEPVFEKKLYYRAEHIVRGLKIDGDDDGDDVMSEEEDDDVTSAGNGLPHNTTLAKYKDLMVEKVQQHRPEMDKIFPQDGDAEMKIRDCIAKIFRAESAQDVDDQVRLFLDEFFPGQFNQTRKV
eukprot:scaffold902_cov146-Skeletonema_menzelii.AAC.2